jgi:two-component system sensor histidine kinase VicK
VLHRAPPQVNADLPALLAQLHPDDRANLAHYWGQWVRNEVGDEVEIRLQHFGQPNQWFCLTPSYHEMANGRVLLGGTLRDISVLKRYQKTPTFSIASKTLPSKSSRTT